MVPEGAVVEDDAEVAGVVPDDAETVGVKVAIPPAEPGRPVKQGERGIKTRQESSNCSRYRNAD